jgi:hypothetical protein
MGCSVVRMVSDGASSSTTTGVAHPTPADASVNVNTDHICEQREDNIDDNIARSIDTSVHPLQLLQEFGRFQQAHDRLVPRRRPVPPLARTHKELAE